MPDESNTSAVELDRFADPELIIKGEHASPYSHPSAVLGAVALSGSEKRALLATWASDACAVEGRPAWRLLPGTPEPVSVDDVLAALQALDGEGLH
ncbi:MAG TPA: hypothetical protein VHL98_13530 [Microvirga sp.]|jgi:hypothetical protein|nr:hypothetical protein [Microvirga sp.]